MTSDPSSKKPSSPHESKGESTIELLFGELENELEQQTAQSVPVHPESSVQTPSLQQHKSEHKAFAAPVETSIKHFERPRASQKAAPPPIPDAAVQSALHTPSNLIRGSTAGTESTISKSELEPSVRTDRDIRQDPLEEAARLLIDSCEQELTEGPKPSRAAKLHYELGRLHEFPIRDLRRAAAHYREALEHAPEHVPCLHGLRRVLVGGKNYPSTLPLFDSEIRITRDNKKKAALYFEKGRLLEDVMQRREEAKEAYVSALELHKGDESILKALRQCQLDTHSFEELDKAYEQSANIVTSDSRHRAALIIERARLIEVQNPNSDEALELYETALKLDPEASQALAALKRLHSLHNRQRDLIRILEREAERTTDCRVRTMSLLRVGKIHAERLGNRAEAISAMERALRESPGDPTIVSELAALYEEGNFQEPLIDALIQLTSLVESDEERLALLHRIGQLCEESPDRREEAILHYESALKINATHVPVLQALSKLYEQEDRWTELVKMYLSEAETCRNRERSSTCYAKLAAIQETKLNNKSEAAEHYARALSLTPGHLTSFRALSRLYTEEEQWRELIELLEQAVAETGTSTQTISHLFHIGTLYENELHEPTQAAHAYKRILEYDSKHLGAVHALQRAVERASRHQDLVRALDLEIELTESQERQVALLHRTGEVLETHLANRKEALARYRSALELDPKNAAVLGSLGKLYYHSGRWEDLFEVYRRELQHTSNQDKAILLLKMATLCEERIGRDDEATELYRKAVVSDPTNSAALQALSRKLAQRQEWDEVVKVLELELSTRTDVARARLACRIGEIYDERLGQPEKAIKAYELAVHSSSDFYPATDALLRLRRQQNNWVAIAGDLEREASRATDIRITIDKLVQCGDIYAREMLEIRRAVECYQRVLELDKNHLGSLMALEQLQRKRRNWESLSEIYTALADLLQNPQARIAALREQARLRTDFGVGSEVEGQAALEAILSLDEEDPLSLNTLEQIAVRSGNRRLLIEVDQRIVATETDPTTLAAHQTRLGESLEALGDGRALDAYRSALSVDDENIGAIRGLSRIAAKIDDPMILSEAARREAHVAEDAKVAATLLIRSADVRAARLEDVEGALADLEHALEICPESGQAVSRLSTLLRNRGEYTRLSDLLGRAACSTKQTERVAELWLEVSELQSEHLDSLASAIGSLNRGLRSDPNHLSTLRRLATLYARDGQWNESVQLLNRVLQLAPDREVLRDVHLKLASLWDERLGESSRALLSLQAVLALDGENSIAFSRLADLQERQGRLDEATESLERLLQSSVEPGEKASAMVRLARLEMRKGHPDRVEKHLLAAISLDGPNGESAREYKTRLKTPSDWQTYVRALNGYLAKQTKGSRQSVETYLEMVRVLCERLGQVDTALTTLEEGAQEDDSMTLRRELAFRFESSKRHPQALRELRTILDKHIEDVDVWRELAQVYDAMGHPTASLLALDVVRLFGAATESEHQRLSSRSAPVPWIEHAFDKALLWSLGKYAPEQRAAVELLTTLESALTKLYPADLDTFGLTVRDRIASKDTNPTRPIVERVARIFGVSGFELYMHRVRSKSASIELSSPPSLLFPAWLSELSEAQQIFLVAEPLAKLAQHFQALDKLTPRELEVLLASASRSVSERFGAGLTSEDFLDEQNRRIHKALSRRTRKSMEEAADRYINSGRVNFANWVGRVDQIARRIALLLSGDLTAAVEVLRRTDRSSIELIRSRSAVELMPDETNDASALDITEGANNHDHTPETIELVRFWMSESAMQLRVRAGILPKAVIQ